MQSTTSQKWVVLKKVTFTGEGSRWRRRMSLFLRQYQDQEEDPQLPLHQIGSVIRWIEMAAVSICTMNVAGCSGDTRLMMPSLQHIVTTRIRSMSFHSPFLPSRYVKSKHFTGLGEYLPVPNLRLWYANVPGPPLWSDPAASGETSPDTDEITFPDGGLFYLCH